MQPYSIKTYNSIQQKGLDIFSKRSYVVSESEETPDAIVCRSAKLSDEMIAPSTKIIARAGVGVNTIPIERCSERGIVVCNTPGANSNAVKELVMASMLIASRNIHHGLHWMSELSKDAKDGVDAPISTLVEKEKSRFVGTELRGKTIGIIGLGIIGQRVANMCVSFGMNVVGYDPYLSVDGALRLSRAVTREYSLRALVGVADYVSIHVPYLKETHHLIDAALLSQCKKNTVVLNFARAELVDEVAMEKQLNAQAIRMYATDFPTEKLLTHPRVLNIPHLGASTEESEQNCALMACEQVVQYLEYGTIANSVNFPNCALDLTSESRARLLIGNYNKKNVVANISTLLGDAGINIENMINKNKDHIAYSIIDINKSMDEAMIAKLSAVDDVLFVRHLTFRSQHHV